MSMRMRFIQVLVLVLFISIQSFSKEVFLGPKLGFSIHKASFNFSEDEEIFDQKLRVGYQIGGAFTMPLQNIFAFHTELYFTKKGKKTIILENNLENQSSYYYLEAPVLLRLNFEGGASPAGSYKFHFDIGPTLSYWLGGSGTVGLEGFKKYKVVFAKDTSAVAGPDELMITGANRLQWGLNLGVGIEYPIVRKQTLFADVRYVIGHSNLIESEGSSSFDLFGYDDDLNVHYRQFVISVSYMFSYDWRLGLKGKSTIKKRKQY